MSSGPRTSFTYDDEAFLVKYLAKYTPENTSRSGNRLYQTLVENQENKWPWAARHTWQSWRSRYRDRKDEFDYNIRKYQKKHSTAPDGVKEVKKRLTAKAGRKTAHSVYASQASQPKEESEKEEGEEGERDQLPPKPMIRRKPDLRLPPTEVSPTREASENEEPPLPADGNPPRKTPQLTSVPQAPRSRAESEEPVPNGKRRANSGCQPNNSKRRRIDEEKRPSARNAKREEEESPAVHTNQRAKGTTPSVREEERVKEKEKSMREEKREGLEDALSREEVKEMGKWVDEPIRKPPSGRKQHQPARQDYSQSTPPDQTAGPSRSNDGVNPHESSGIRPHHSPSRHPSPPLQSKEKDKDPLRVEPNVNRLYPDLSQLDDIATMAAPTKAFGSIAAVSGTLPTFSAPKGKFMDKGIQADAPTNPFNPSPEVGHLPGSFHSADGDKFEPGLDGDGPQQSSLPPVKRSVAASLKSKEPPHRESEDYFASSPSPPPSQLAPSSSTSPLSRSHASVPPSRPDPRNRNNAGRQYLAKRRDPPRVVDGAFRSALTNGRHSAPKKRARVVISECESDELKQVDGQSSRGIFRLNKTEKERQVGDDIASAPRASTADSDSIVAHVSPVEVSGEVGVNEAKTHGTPPKLTVKASASSLATTEIIDDSNASTSDPSEEDSSLVALREWRFRARDAVIRSSEVPSIAGSDPFLASNPPRRLQKGKFKERLLDDTRRQTFSGFSKTPLVPQIDLRRKPFLGGSSAQHRRRSSTSAPLATGAESSLSLGRHSRQASLNSLIDFTSPIPSPSHQISASDQHYMNQAGLQALIKGMAQNHNFSEELVRRMWEECKDFPATDALLRKMKTAYEKVAHDTLNVTTPEDDHVEADDVREKKAEWEQKNESLVTLPAATELKWFRATEEVIREHVRDRYSPPQASRAAQFVRLAAQGREKEAIKREVRRSTGTSSTPKKSSLRPDSLVLLPSSPMHIPSSAISDPQQSSSAGSLVWTAADDAILVSGNDLALKRLELRMGRGSVKHRTAELMAQGMLL